MGERYGIESFNQELLNRNWHDSPAKFGHGIENSVVIPERMVALDHPKAQRLINGSIHKYTMILPFLEKNSRVLDACAGSGWGASYLASSGHTVTAMDSGLMWAKYRSDIEIAECDLFDFKPEHKFDAVCMIDAVEHFKKSHQLPAIQHLYSLLKPNGWFIMDTPRVKVTGRQSSHHPSCLNWVDFLEAFEKMGTCVDIQRYTISSSKGYSMVKRVYLDDMEPEYFDHQDQIIIGRKHENEL